MLGRQATGSIYEFEIGQTGPPLLVTGGIVEDLEFDPAGNLYASNANGIFRIDPGPTSVQVSAHATSQFVFDSPTTVVRTNGTAYSSMFGTGTHRIDLADDSFTTLLTDGGEDVEIDDSGSILVLLSAQSGLFELDSGGTLTPLFTLDSIFDFEPVPNTGTFVGNPEFFASFALSPGVFLLDSSNAFVGQITNEDINSIEVLVTVVPLPSAAWGGLGLLGAGAMRCWKRTRARG